MRNQLIKLFLANSAKPHSYEIKAAAADEAEIFLYDAIGSWWGIGAESFVKDLKALDAKTIHLRINSPGGDVFEARTMATALSQHKAKVVAHIDGLAASAATTVALGADEVEIAEGAMFMIHNPWTLSIGDSGDMRKAADLLDKITVDIARDYTAKTGKSADEIKAWMDAETWFSAEEAKTNGFVDRVAAKEKKATNAWDLSAYRNAPRPSEPPADEIRFDFEAMERRLWLFEKTA